MSTVTVVAVYYATCVARDDVIPDSPFAPRFNDVGNATMVTTMTLNVTGMYEMMTRQQQRDTNVAPFFAPTTTSRYAVNMAALTH